VLPALSIFRRSFRRCGRAAAQSAQLRLAGGHRVRAIPIWVRPHDGHLQGFGRTSVGLADVGRHFFCVDSLCPEFRLPAEAGCRCSDRDPAGHVSGISVVPLSTPGPQAARGGEIGGAQVVSRGGFARGLAILFHRGEERWHSQGSFRVHDLSGPEL